MKCKGTTRIVGLMMAVTMMVGAFGMTTVAQAAEMNEFEYLKAAIQKIDSVSEDEVSQFVQENREWIDEVDARLDSYLDEFSESDQQIEVANLVGDDVSTLAAGNLDEYFTYVEYHKRGGYGTYSMDPKLSVRLLGSVMQAAWQELGNNYSGIRNDNGSLWNQYRCHWDYDAFGIVAGIWDLEVGRPVIPYEDMFAARCNP